MATASISAAFAEASYSKALSSLEADAGSSRRMRAVNGCSSLASAGEAVVPPRPTTRPTATATNARTMKRAAPARPGVQRCLLRARTSSIIVRASPPIISTCKGTKEPGAALWASSVTGDEEKFAEARGSLVTIGFSVLSSPDVERRERWIFSATDKPRVRAGVAVAGGT